MLWAYESFITSSFCPFSTFVFTTTLLLLPFRKYEYLSFLLKYSSLYMLLLVLLSYITSFRSVFFSFSNIVIRSGVWFGSLALESNVPRKLLLTSFSVNSVRAAGVIPAFLQ